MESEMMVRAKMIVRDFVNGNLEKTDPDVSYDVYVVWFAKVLRNWKALLSTTLPDGKYYEVTHNGEAGETYIDAYLKVGNMVYMDAWKAED